ncbi:MTRF1L release factor glutamine methyltransferase-like [Teleopsis dalmanni]|uniref:MTRF1L release factor glutamine methyltransferase-like n=1 Tax=Teleopsis dalmanni TaxID=139649 RepID=UPI0018CE2709|nr:MTRF1L release factor glutamine methyltransferase-like [Teleopsis dalmanni]
MKEIQNTISDYLSTSLNDKQVQELNRLCEARCGRMPLQYIIGEWDFMNITLRTAPTVFIPRPETEEFVQKVINEYRDVSELNLLEVGCGSGAMSLAILHELPQVRSFAIERSLTATHLAKENVKLLDLEDRFEVFNHIMEADNYLPPELCEKTFDVIISNPPYVKTEEFQYLQPEVTAYENLNALDGGPDGLKVARLVFNLASLYLRSGGKLWLELGTDHPQLVKRIMNRQYSGRLKYVAGYKDQYKQERFVEIERV